MWWNRTFLCGFLAGSVILGTSWGIAQGVQGPRTAPPTKPTPPPPPKEDPEAVKFLDQAITKVEKLSWVETTLWEQIHLHGALFQAEGSYLAGPGQRLHLDLKVNAGGVTGKLELVCDENMVLWEAHRVGSGDRVVDRKVELKKVVESIRDPALKEEQLAKVKEELLHNQSFAWVTPLIKALKERLVLTKVEKNLKWKDRDSGTEHEVVQLTGAWKQDKQLPPADNWPPFVPRECRLMLDEKTGWPYRLEWWGPAPPAPGRDGLLVEIEYRKPNFQEPPAERLKGKFQFDQGSAKVTDRTEDQIKMVKERLDALKRSR